MQIILGGCSGQMQKHNDPTSSPTAHSHESSGTELPSATVGQNKTIRQQPTPEELVEELYSAPPPTSFALPSNESLRSLTTAALYAPKPGQNRQLLPGGSRESQLRYAELIREMGTAAEKRRLREFLAYNLDDPAFLNFSIGWHLELEEYDAARYLVRRAQANNQTIPLWQSLTLAIDEGDAKTVERLLSEPDVDLPVATQVTALRAVGLDQQALTLAQNYLDTMPKESQAEEIARQANALALSRSHHFGLEWAMRELGSLEIKNGATLFDFYTPFARLALAISRNQLDSESRNLSVTDFDKELDLSLRAKRLKPSKQRELELEVGGNKRDDKSILYGQAAWAQRIIPELRGRLTLSLNEIADTTPNLRAIGTKHSISFGATANLDRWEIARAKLELHRYQTRDNDKLGTGFSTEAALGHVVFQELPRLHFELRGSLEKNNVKSDVPDKLVPSVLSPSVKMDDIVPPDYRSLGIGTTFEYGSTEIDQKRLMLDAYAGWIWPNNEGSYRVSFSAGIPVFSRGMLSIDGFYANALSGVTDDSYHRLGISYRYRF